MDQTSSGLLKISCLTFVEEANSVRADVLYIDKSFPVNFFKEFLRRR